tara:strand:- start:241 stop:1026 length:786 start_codon:yes stop_codon:yes gene_type:complete
MIQALVNGVWKSFDEDELQPGTDSFTTNTGLYETFRTKNFKPILLQPHLDRLFQSSEKINLKIIYSRKEIEKMITMVIHNFHEKDQRARIIVSKNKVIVYTTALDLDKQIYDGVDTLTISYERNTPDIKTTDYKGCLDAYKKANKSSCFEAILLDRNNCILEGSRSNVFWVISNSLFTRENSVLPGITRKTIIENSPTPILYEKLNIFDINRVDELFLTNSGSGIIPVRKVDSVIINNGLPGPITFKLLELFNLWSKKPFK